MRKDRDLGVRHGYTPTLPEPQAVDVGSFMAGQSISSLEALAVALSARNGRGERERLLVLMR